MSDTPYRAGDLATMPDFRLPFPAGTVVSIQTYVGHDPDDKKMDCYAEGWPDGSAVLAAAAGLVHQWFDPGGIEINHGDGWFTTYMHMDQRLAVGNTVEQGDWVGRADTIGTWAKHLHHEHLYRGPAAGGASDADTVDMVNPVIQGEGPLVLIPNKPIVMTSTNGEKGPEMSQYGPEHWDAADWDAVTSKLANPLFARSRISLRNALGALVTHQPKWWWNHHNAPALVHEHFDNAEHLADVDRSAEAVAKTRPQPHPAGTP